MAKSKETDVYRKDASTKHNLLTPKQREDLIKPYLPKAPKSRPTSKRSRPIREFLRNQFHLFVFIIIHLLFSIYVRIRQTYHVLFDRALAVLYYHHRAPELIKQDVKGLTRVPEHLSVILELRGDERDQAGLEGLMDEVAEIAAWCTCVGIPMLSVYERTGILKHYIPNTHRAVSSKMHSYFGGDVPSLQVGAPNISSYLNGNAAPRTGDASSRHLSILLLSAEDGRSTLVDLTKTLTEMSQRKKLAPSDVSQDLVDAEITESVMGEPDLLILFGQDVKLQGYPPWQIRLTEIYHVQDSNGVGYQVFLRALHNYSKAQMKFGR